MPELEYLDHGRIILPTNGDPAINRVEGYERYFLGLDLGRNDPTALVLVRDRQLPQWKTSIRQELGKRTRTVVLCRPHTRDGLHGHRRACRASCSRERSSRERRRLCVDATGLGTPFCDVLTEGGIDHLAITMTAGASWTRTGHRVTVSKNLLLETLASGFETGALTIAHDLPLRAELTTEIASFELATTQAGNLVLQGGGRGASCGYGRCTCARVVRVGEVGGWSGAGGAVGKLVLRGGGDLGRPTAN